MLRLTLEGRGGGVRVSTLYVFDITVQQNTTLHHYVQNNSK